MKQLILASLLALLSLGCNSLNPGHEAKLKDLQRVISELPLYSEFQQTGSNHIIKSDNAVLSYYYQSTAPYEEVKSFYSTKLPEKGWSLSKEESLDGWFKRTGSIRLIFQKGEYKAYIEFKGNDSSSWNYGISVDWERNK